MRVELQLHRTEIFANLIQNHLAAFQRGCLVGVVFDFFGRPRASAPCRCQRYFCSASFATAAPSLPPMMRLTKPWLAQAKSARGEQSPRPRGKGTDRLPRPPHGPPGPPRPPTASRRPSRPLTAPHGPDGPHGPPRPLTDPHGPPQTSGVVGSRGVPWWAVGSRGGGRGETVGGWWRAARMPWGGRGRR